MNEIKLTDSEKGLMEILWEKEKAFMKEILDVYPEPKPATTTVATLLKRMQNKNLTIIRRSWKPSAMGSQGRTTYQPYQE